MSAIFRKTPKGDIEAWAINDSAPILTTRSFRMVEGFRVDLIQWVDPVNMASYIALRNPCIQMLDNSEDAGFMCYDDDDNDADSRYMRYEGVVLLMMLDLHYTTDPLAYLVNLEGYTLAGSNVYASGNLCLGDSFNSLSLQAAELLIHNTANSDLGWRGDALEGNFANNVFNTTLWPHLSHFRNPPVEILADIKRWWPT